MTRLDHLDDQFSRKKKSAHSLSFTKSSIQFVLAFHIRIGSSIGAKGLFMNYQLARWRSSNPIMPMQLRGFRCGAQSVSHPSINLS
jgi:hypothetical protein